jgi:hypothetical protein
MSKPLELSITVQKLLDKTVSENFQNKYINRELKKILTEDYRIIRAHMMGLREKRSVKKYVGVPGQKLRNTIKRAKQ